MTDFSEALRALGDRLPIPEPARSRVLLEMAADMDDLLEHYLAQGRSAEEAARAVETHFQVDDAAIQELVRIHTGPLERSVAGVTRRAHAGWERGLMALVALVVAPGLVALLVQPGLLTDASAPAYPLLAMLAAALATGLWKATSLFGPGTASGRPAPRKGLRALPALAALMVVVGFVGSWLELYRTAVGIRGSSASSLPPLVGWLHATSATLVVALSGALLTALLWFVLEARAATLDQKAAASLLNRES